MSRRLLVGAVCAVLAVATCQAAVQSPSVPGSSSAVVPSVAAAPSTGPTSTVPVPSSSPPVVPAASPSIDPAAFTTTIDNPWFPLVPGTTLSYRGTKDGKPAVDAYQVTTETRVIDGVACVVVKDTLYLAGKLEETTRDYYVQDKLGNVWYFGEDTQELDATGKVTSTEGTWHAGDDGAEPGIFMEATPTIGRALRQEYYQGHAEDHFEVLSLTSSVKVPYRAFQGVALRTKEWTPLEPDVLDNKYYIRGIGEVREVSVKGPREELVLVKVERP